MIYSIVLKEYRELLDDLCLRKWNGWATNRSIQSWAHNLLRLWPSLRLLWRRRLYALMHHKFSLLLNSNVTLFAAITDDHLLGVYCGGRGPHYVNSSDGGALTLVFKTDDSKQFLGFELMFRTVPCKCQILPNALNFRGKLIIWGDFLFVLQMTRSLVSVPS